MFSKTAVVHTDLSFLREFWLNDPNTVRTAPLGERVGVILRHWPDGQEPRAHISKLIRQIGYLKERPILISFDEASDQELIKEMRDYSWLIWRPEEFTLDDFIKEMKSRCRLLVSTRAHGVLVAAAVGIPVVAYEIEPKLSVAHHYFRNSALLLSPHNVTDLPSLVTKNLNFNANWSCILDDEYAIQEKIAKRMAAEFNQWASRNVTIR
jgi:polysaccharide pyruvyl transferase WcaK-like protein